MMRRSFVRLLIGSVAASWALGFAVLAIWVRSQNWTEARARQDGVFLVHQLLESTPAARRAERLRELQRHFFVRFSLASLAQVERRSGTRLAPGQHYFYRESALRQWYFVALGDGKSALVAGPVTPAQPGGAQPMGLVIAIFALPLLAGFIAFTVERRLRRVEVASQALADGELSVRVATREAASDELAASFNAMAERVERLVRRRDELVQAVSHELGSPLSRLRFHIELLENLSNARQRDRIGAMSRELDALEELVAELLSYVQSDELKLDRRHFEPRQGLEDLAELAQLDAPVGDEGSPERAVGIELELAEGVRVHADQRLFLRAVENILRNAMRHARTSVRLEFSEDRGEVRVDVHDDGPGIPEGLREKVIVPFYRADADRARKTGGVGLGLAIVSRIMQRHEGRVSIETSPALGGAMVSTSWPKIS